MSQPRTYRSDGGRWAKARETYLAHHPFCVPCTKAGRRVRATHVDHKIPHRGNQQLFWDKANWEARCSTCHNGDKQIQEKSGRVQYRGCSEDGSPLDPNHNWRSKS